MKDTMAAKWNRNSVYSMPEVSDERKNFPLAEGFVDYFSLAIMEVARLSRAGNDKHNPGEPLHWSRGKSDDHDDCLLRHFIERGDLDTDGIPHRAKVAWRALAALQLEMEARLFDLSDG